ncbi:MAG: glycosyltransferase family 4 protein [Nitrososphaerota archaeon]|jgi:glycosyltransferase involved in cell wall biosynthesis|nr:glycosyltransferase family 4 protein [Nitrososphaerota archaeon]
MGSETLDQNNLLYKSVFVTTNFGLDTGSGNVSRHQAKALAAVTNVERVITEADINSQLFQLPDTARDFMWDYLVAHELKDCAVDLAFFNGSPFGMALSLLKPAKTIVDISAHNLELGVEEFERRNGLGTYPVAHLVDPFLWNVYSQHIQNADIVLCPSKLSADYISTKLSLKNAMAVIPPGCYLPEENTIRFSEDFCITHVGINTNDRGQLYLVHAWQKLKQNHNFSGRIFMVGRGTNMWLPFGVSALEYIDNIGTVYNDCSVYVQPSVTEGFGIPVLEAMAYYRPVIVTEGAGSSELVEDGKEGFVIPIRNPEAIKDKIQYFYDNPGEIKRMGKNARTKAEEYTWNKIEEKYQNLIKILLTKT